MRSRISVTDSAATNCSLMMVPADAGLAYVPVAGTTRTSSTELDVDIAAGQLVLEMRAGVRVAAGIPEARTRLTCDVERQNAVEQVIRTSPTALKRIAGRRQSGRWWIVKVAVVRRRDPPNGWPAGESFGAGGEPLPTFHNRTVDCIRHPIRRS